MNEVNGKLTVIFDNLDDPEAEPLKIVDGLEIDSLHYEMKRPHKRTQADRYLEKQELIPGPFTGKFTFKEKEKAKYKEIPGTEVGSY